MEATKKVSAGKLCALSGALLLSVFSTLASAGSYQSSVTLPTVFSRNFMETAYLPVVGSPPTVGLINNVTWNWNVVGFPVGLSVALCQGTTSNCIDVSRVRSMSTTAFNNKSPAQRFFFALRVANGGTIPVAGQLGKVTVSWN